MKTLFYTLPVLLILSCFTILNAQVLPYQDTTLTIEQRVNDLLGRMTQNEKIGQMMQVDLWTTGIKTPVINYFAGSVFSGGGSDPVKDNSALSWANTYDSIQTLALQTRLKIPIIYGIDAVHGHNNVVGATIFPHNIGLGCTRNPDLIKEAARITAQEIAATGIDWTFAPCIAVPRDERWGRTYEGFGETPELAEMFATAEVVGFQGDSLSGNSIVACAKHYLGDGGTTNGIDRGNTELSEEEIRKIHLPGYIAALNSNVGTVMASFSSINGQNMHSNKYWLTDVLKNELGFKGFVVSDWAGIDNLGGTYTNCVEHSINAGLDMVMLPNRYTDFYNAMTSLIKDGKITAARVDDAVKRILTIKFKLGLFEKPFVDRSLLSSVGSLDHRAVARQCVRESIVLLKKKDSILPLPKTNVRILVSGTHADDIGNQCGGWTISWQGQSGNITIGTTILQGMKNIAPNADIEYSKTGEFSDTKADYSVVIIGEVPYAESAGNRSDLGISKADVNLIKKMKSFGAPVILVLVSGRPLILEKVLHYADAIFAVWLPGTEGEGIADILFGDDQPKGLLSHTWPKNMAQIPINFGDTKYDPLYPYGFGITSFADSPAGSAPVCLSAIVTSDGKHLELTFNKKMKDPASSQAQFALTCNKLPISSVTSLSLKQDDSTTIIISLDSVLFRINDLASLSYNSGTIESSDNGLLQPFNSLDAYNWSESKATSVEENTLIPTANRLNQNYPNPFNPETSISYHLAVRSLVHLKIYDLLSREVISLVDMEQNAGNYIVKFNGSNLASGIYFYTLKAINPIDNHIFSETKKLLLLR